MHQRWTKQQKPQRASKTINAVEFIQEESKSEESLSKKHKAPVTGDKSVDLQLLMRQKGFPLMVIASVEQHPESQLSLRWAEKTRSTLSSHQQTLESAQTYSTSCISNENWFSGFCNNWWSSLKHYYQLLKGLNYFCSIFQVFTTLLVNLSVRWRPVCICICK